MIGVRNVPGHYARPPGPLQQPVGPTRIELSVCHSVRKDQFAKTAHLLTTFPLFYVLLACRYNGFVYKFIFSYLSEWSER